ncbi:signal transduction histidine kinase [Herbihabitans rhizosphaerae]|uniref:histidine kinase n=1 Tax=Herbihabitans rhizosphaerae TaxID=1872711 RepID=A0A4Q7KY89_9PSEU|nr:ATP-binding protein [Herbihabitans rhizosphaerae]RZS40991.1 signal transduction histidine kinase [Herbihabitans rhizosphaerae]
MRIPRVRRPRLKPRSLHGKLAFGAVLIMAVPLTLACVVSVLWQKSTLVDETLREARKSVCRSITTPSAREDDYAKWPRVFQCEFRYRGTPNGLITTQELWYTPNNERPEAPGAHYQDYVVDVDGVANLSISPFADPGDARITLTFRVPWSIYGSTTNPPVQQHELRVSSLVPEQRELNSFTTAVYGGLLLVLALTGGLAWLVAGRLLRPVETFRRHVAAVAATNLEVRVPVPPRSDEFARLAKTLNATLDRLDHAVAKQRRFVADAAHELRGPIGGLRAELEIAVTHPDQADWQEVVGRALEDTERIQELATDLLLLARLDADPPDTRGLIDLVGTTAEELAVYRPRREIKILDELNSEPIMVHGGGKLLARMLRNLLDNAVRHATTTVRVRVHREGRVAVLEVADDGVGIPPADRERVFERFTRLDEARNRDAGGAGLGLAIARQIATAHHGTLIAVPSEVGARFVARFPVR